MSGTRPPTRSSTASPPTANESTTQVTSATNFPHPSRQVRGVDFEALFEDHFDAIYGYLARRVGPDLARDLAAETFTRGYAARKRFDPRRGEPRAWLFGIAHNLLRRHYRD